jgi:hypothetical protein
MILQGSGIGEKKDGFAVLTKKHYRRNPECGRRFFIGKNRQEENVLLADSAPEKSSVLDLRA